MREGLSSSKRQNCIRIYFLLSLLDGVRDQLHFGRELYVSGLAIAEWIKLTHTPRWVLTDSECQALVGLSIRHRIYSEQANIAILPKHHALGHASIRSWAGQTL